MTFDDFLEFFYAKLRRYRDVAAADGRIQFGTRKVRRDHFLRFLDTVSAAHVFLMGTEDSLNDTLRFLYDDLLRDMAGSLPMPYDNMLMVYQRESGPWWVEWIYRRGGPGNVSPGIEGFLFTTFTEEQLRQDLVQPWLGAHADWTKPRPTGDYTLTLYECPWEGETTDEDLSEQLPHEEQQSLFQQALAVAGHSTMGCAALTHPYLYLVEAKPELTPREQRQSEKRGQIPDRKRPRYIVVDRTGFEEMRRPALGGTHAPPIAHERKGHWRRLSERCVHARAEGRTRTFVRDTIVGTTEFRDERATYKLVLEPARLREK